MGNVFVGGILLLYLAAFAISIAISYYVIQAATRTNKRFKYEIIRTKLLVKIAERSGVDAEEINQIVNE